MAQLVERQKTSLMEDTRELFLAELEEDWTLLEARGAEQRRMLRLQKASAWFMAAYVLQQQDGGGGETAPGARFFYSFPWCIAHVILEAKCWLRQTFPCTWSRILRGSMHLFIIIFIIIILIIVIIISLYRLVSLLTGWF